MDYRIITVEGNIGSGKTSFARLLAAEMKAKLILETFADNPFLQKFFVKQQDYALGMEMFFMAERYEQLNREMNDQELFNERYVIDYLFNKSLLYARVNLDDTEFNLYQKIFNLLNPRMRKSDVVIYLHSDLDRLVSNIYKRGREFELTVKKDYLKKIENVYLEHFRQVTDQKTLIFDVSDADFVANATDFQKMLSIIAEPHAEGVHRFKI
ncbi:MAG: deoxynucleoside kinase [Chitinophagales bacterium]|jgi:deoxyadenosine/deoxycytidine kinase|nr:deoxynucleoside kinase [Bacteroidota bacterium]MBK9554780.1 deoxynucleoside kinase [Bacteroidota bacterium]MBL0281237.1 deoxynucleoside kinase [Bacteroidota bacterium]MBP9879054.1 deoxynucleoside kinase [Chitinophagales bacterium]